jgi:hypothetical protein
LGRHLDTESSEVRPLEGAKHKHYGNIVFLFCYNPSMPYIELRNYTSQEDSITVKQRDEILELVRDHIARGQEIDGTFEFRILNSGSELDYCEYEYILVIDMGYSKEREKKKSEVAESIGKHLSSILGSESIAVRVRLQNASFVPS